MAPLALVANFATRWHHLHWLQIWPPDGTTCITCKTCITFITCITCISFKKVEWVSEFQRLGPIDRTPGIPRSDKNCDTLPLNSTQVYTNKFPIMNLFSEYSSYNMTVCFKNVPIPTFMLSQAESKIAFISRTGEVPMECPLLIKTLILRQLHCHQLAATLRSFYFLTPVECWQK